MTTVLAALLVALVVVVLATPTYGKRQAWEHDPEKSNEERSTRSSSALLVNEGVEVFDSPRKEGA